MEFLVADCSLDKHTNFLSMNSSKLTVSSNFVVFGMSTKIYQILGQKLNCIIFDSSIQDNQSRVANNLEWNLRSRKIHIYKELSHSRARFLAWLNLAQSLASSRIDLELLGWFLMFLKDAPTLPRVDVSQQH